MNSNRIQMLEKQMKEDPKDPFYGYALALEYKDSDPEKCLDYLKETQKKFPSYLPLYYQMAEQFTELNDRENALKAYEKGILLAAEQKDLKTLAELKNARQNLLFDDDI